VHHALHAQPFVIASPVHAYLSAVHAKQCVISTSQEQIVSGTNWAFRTTACSMPNSVYTRVFDGGKTGPFGKAMCM